MNANTMNLINAFKDCDSGQEIYDALQVIPLDNLVQINHMIADILEGHITGGVSHN